MISYPRASFRACRRTVVSLFTLCSLFLTYAQTSFAAQSLGVAVDAGTESVTKSYQLEILSGAVTIEGGFCAGPCPTRVSMLTGTFTANFGSNPGSTYYPTFVESKIVSEPKVGFQLLEYPHTEDSIQSFETGDPDAVLEPLPMTLNRVDSFAFDGEILSIQGVLEPSQYVADLPTTTYEIRAQVMKPDFAYYLIERDLRECLAPSCGGYFIKMVNGDTTPCFGGIDRIEQSRCYVESVHWLLGGKELMVDHGSEPLLVKGAFSESSFNRDYPAPFGRLLITEANRPVSKESQDYPGMFAAVKHNGLVCITQPCPSYDMTILNEGGEQTLSSLDYRSVSVSPNDLEQIEQQLGSEKGLLGSGALALPSPLPGADGSSGVMIGHFSYSQIYLPIKQSAPAPAADAVWVEKWDGALTCQQGSARSLEESKADLTGKGIAVQASQCGNLTGVFIPAVCNIEGLGVHLHLISPADVAEAERLGFDAITEDKFQITECPEQAATPDQVVISKAVYRESRGELRVVAYSDEPDVELTVEGYGVMKFSKRKGVYRLRVKNITDPGEKVTVRSSAGGVATKAVKFR